MRYKSQSSYSSKAQDHLKMYLDGFLEHFDFSHHISKDPVLFVHRFKEPQDREITGILSACFAYGRVDKILGFLERLFEILGEHPYLFVLNYEPDLKRDPLRSLQYRFHKYEHISSLILLLKKVLIRYFSLENLFLEGYSQSAGLKAGLSNFVQKILQQDIPSADIGNHLVIESPVRFFFPSPEKGSTCKRLNLFLRWMVRGPDKVDLGLWKRVSKKDLVIPLDTHVARICKNLGLTSLSTSSWKMACQITDKLKALDPEDPVKYDFAICHLGISGDCPSLQDWRKCRPCELRPVCKCWEG